MAFMDINQEPDRAQRSSPAPTKPLRIHKQPSPSRVARSQRSCDSNRTPGHFNATRYPPRTSSLRKDGDKNMVARDNCRVKNRVPQNNNNFSPVHSTQSTAVSTSIYDTSIAGSQSTARSTVSSFKELYISDSAEIIGNFVPVNTVEMVLPSLIADDYTNLSDA